MRGIMSVWRQALATGGTLQNETASPGVVDQADYDAWRANFGAASGSGSGAGMAGVGVPEPETAALFVLAAALALGCTDLRWSHRPMRDF